MTTGTIDPRYGDASATAPAWTDVERLLAEAQLYWIVTVRTDGADGDDWHFAVRGDELVEQGTSGGGTTGALVHRVAPTKVILFGGGHGQTTYRP